MPNLVCSQAPESLDTVAPRYDVGQTDYHNGWGRLAESMVLVYPVRGNMCSKHVSILQRHAYDRKRSRRSVRRTRGDCRERQGSVGS
jgi:hypothetical protein